MNVVVSVVRSHRSKSLVCHLMLLLSAMALGTGCASHKSAAAAGTTNAAGAPAVYTGPEDAVVACIEAARMGDLDKIHAIFGDGVDGMVSHSNEITSADLQRLAAAYDRQHALITESDGSVTLEVGESHWRFPAPLVSQAGKWHFDTAAGVEVVRQRRIEKNESEAISTLFACIVAEQEYIVLSTLINAAPGAPAAYAQRISSTPGTRDGLYWSDDLPGPRSPLGPMISSAVDEGRLNNPDGKIFPFYGYRFRVLKAQGSAASGGMKNYIDANGFMTGGFAFLAFPNEYGDSGVMTYMIGSDGSLFARDLGPQSVILAKSMTAFDPGEGWQRVEPQGASVR